MGQDTVTASINIKTRQPASYQRESASSLMTQTQNPYDDFYLPEDVCGSFFPRSAPIESTLEEAPEQKATTYLTDHPEEIEALKKYQHYRTAPPSQKALLQKSANFTREQITIWKKACVLNEDGTLSPYTQNFLKPQKTEQTTHVAVEELKSATDTLIRSHADYKKTQELRPHQLKKKSFQFSPSLKYPTALTGSVFSQNPEAFRTILPTAPQTIKQEKAPEETAFTFEREDCIPALPYFTTSLLSQSFEKKQQSQAIQ